MGYLRIKIDYLLYKYWWRIPFPSYELRFKYNFPTKRLVEYCWNNFSKGRISYKYEMVAHMYAFDSTVTEEDLSLIHACYNTSTRERVRQVLDKFVRTYYR